MQTIYIDISNKGVIQPIYTKQGDIGRKFVAVFMENGQKYNIPSGSLFSAWYKGPSGEGNYTDIGEKSAFSIANNKVTVELISEMLGVPGEGFVCLVLTKNDGGQIGSWNIPYICEEVPGFGSEEAKEYYTAFSKLVDSIKSNPENITIDDTLSVPNAAADAFAVGAKFIEEGLKWQEHDVSIANNTVDIDQLKMAVEELESSSGGMTDEEFAAKVEETVVENLENGGDIFDGVHAISIDVSEQSLYYAHLVEYAENGEQIYHAERIDNPHQVTAEQVGAVKEEELLEKVENIVVSGLTNEGPIRTRTYEVADIASEDMLKYYELIRPDEDADSGYSLNVVTKEQHNEDIKAVIVTVSSNVPSHTSQEIYALIQAGKVVYLFYGDNYIICASATTGEAKFESSFMTTITGADGKSYPVQYFRMYVVKNEKFGPSSKIMASQDYVDAMIQYYLGQ